VATRPFSFQHLGSYQGIVATFDFLTLSVPSAIAAASALGLAERSRALAGDFLTYVPEADIYLLKHVLHDWNDGGAVRILERCREAMRPGGRVIVIEMLLGEIGEPRLAPLIDLNRFRGLFQVGSQTPIQSVRHSIQISASRSCWKVSYALQELRNHRGVLPSCS
jgi:hypothetical protein